jgi:hypothetical protein
MATKFFTDRSRTETYQRCPRQRYWEYMQPNGTGTPGIVPVRKSLALVVGGCVHEGLAVLLWEGQKLKYEMENGKQEAAGVGTLWFLNEQKAVNAGVGAFNMILADTKLELDAREQAELTEVVKLAVTEPVVDFSAEFGLSQEQTRKLVEPNRSAELQEQYLVTEQRNLVEALIRAYSRRRLLPLLEEFEVLEVEREGDWLLSEWRASSEICHRPFAIDSLGPRYYCSKPIGHDGSCETENERLAIPKTVHLDSELWWMSRPDALLRHKVTNDLQIMSFKTTGAWDVRKERDALRDMQGLSEGVEVERRLADWWERMQTGKVLHGDAEFSRMLHDVADIPGPIIDYLMVLAAPPRISAIRYEYLLKGERWKDKQLSEKLGIECRSQNTPLLQPYKKIGITALDDEWGWKYEYEDSEGRSKRLDYRSWKKTPVWEHMSMKAWIDMLDQGQVQPQAGDALAAQFVNPMTIYRLDDDLRDWIEQVEAQEVQVVKDAAQVAGAQDDDEKRHLLNVLFPQTRRACEYPGTCSYVSICFGSSDIRRDPVGSGKFRARVANHPQEAQCPSTR